MFRIRLADKSAFLKALLTSTAAAALSGTRPTPRKASARAGLMEALEGRVLLSSVPQGSVTTFTNSTIAGLAYNADNGANAVTVRVTIDGTTADVTANQDSAATQPASWLGTAHGFTYAIPSLAPGTHKVTVGIVRGDQKLQIIKSGTLTNTPPKGFVNKITGNVISGYAYDKDAGSGPVTVRIDNNGVTIGTVTADQQLPTATTPGLVNDPNHGFSFTVPDGVTLGVVDVFATDAPTNTPVLISSTNKPAKGTAQISRAKITGTAVDPDNPDDTLQVEIRVDGVVIDTITAGDPATGVPGVPGTSNHGFTFTMPGLTIGKHEVSVWAIDTKTSSATKVLISKAFVTNTGPTGKITKASGTGISGTASDPDQKGAPLHLEVEVDGVVVTTLDSTKTPYTITFPTPLDNNPHKITLFATDVGGTGQRVKLDEKVVNNLLPVGKIQSGDNFTVTGYAYDPNSPNTPVDVIVVMDGAQYPSVSASQPDANVPPGVGANAGFTVDVPISLPGSHTIKLYVNDTFTGQRTLVATRTFTNKKPTGAVTQFTTAGIQGYVYDPDAPAANIGLLLQIFDMQGNLLNNSNGQGGTLGVANLNVTKPKLPAAAGQNHGFAVPLGAIPPGTYRFKLFAIDWTGSPTQGVTTLLAQKVLTFA